MKKLFSIFAFLMWSVAVIAQTHTVARGENLQSIAAKYNITEAQLIEANPGADKLFYVGLKLNIPNPSQTTAVANQANTNLSLNREANQTDTATNIATAYEADDDKPGVEASMMLEYGFLPKIEGVNGTNYTYAATVGANYFFMHRNSGVFAGARIGYNSANLNSHVSDGHGNYVTQTSTAHFITLPINGGYAFATSNRNLAITPYAGLDFNFCVAGKAKMKSRVAGETINSSANLKKEVGIDARIGVQLRLWGFNLGASYVIPLNNGQKMYFGSDSYMAINIGFGF